MLSKHLAGFVFTFCVFTANSQPGVNGSGLITGNLIVESEKPVSSASLILIKLTGKDSLAVKGALSDELGKFRFLNVPAGRYFLKISLAGYISKALGPLDISDSHRIVLNDVEMLPYSNQLNTVYVKRSKPLVERRLGKVILHVDGSILATGSSALEILERAPGVSVDNLGNISVKGRQGAQIMVDGKSTNLAREDLLNLLRSTEGSLIQSIEIITNPSSRYDAAGTSGIINIKMKKNTSYGTNGSITAGSGYGNYHKLNAALTVNHRQKHFNVFGNYSYSYDKSTTDLETTRESRSRDESTFFRRTGRAVEVARSNTYKAGVDYFVNKNNIIGFVASGFTNKGSASSPNITFIGSKPLSTDSLIRAMNYSERRNSNVGLNLNYRSILDTSGRQFTVDLDYAHYGSRANSRYNNFFELSTHSMKDPDIFRNFAPSNVQIWSGKADYEHALNRSDKLEAGIKSSYVTTDNDFVFENLKSDIWQNNGNRTNHFVYKENINAAYISLTHTFSNTTLKYGLRAEYTKSNGNSLTLNKVVDRNYFNLFPSVFVSRKITKDNMLNLSYSRRIDRPDYVSLNPFIEFIDLYTFEQGNPFLNPQYADVAELTYTYKDDYAIVVGFGNTKDAMSTVLLSDEVNKALYLTQENLGKRRYFDVSLSAPVKLLSKWTSQNDLTFLYNTIQSPNLFGLAFKEEKFSFMFNTTQTLELTPTLNAELSANYSSSRIYGTYQIRPMYTVSAGVSKSFYDEKAKIKLAASDIFNTSDIEVSSFKAFSPYDLNQKHETRIFRLSFSYRLGGKQVKGPAERIKSSSEEEGRASNN